MESFPAEEDAGSVDDLVPAFGRVPTEDDEGSLLLVVVLMVARDELADGLPRRIGIFAVVPFSACKG